MRKKKVKKNVTLHPVISFLLLCFGVILLSGVLSLFNVSSTHNVLNSVRLDYSPTTESVQSLLSLSGIKYIFSNTVSNFANFTVLPHLIIMLLGIGVLEYSGCLKTGVVLLTKKAKKKVITFVIVFAGIIASIVDNLPFIAFIPLSALIFKHGKRNPNIGIIASFAAMTCGYGLSFLFSGIDSSLAKMTSTSASVLSANYSIDQFSMVFIMTVTIVIMSFVITAITENIITRKVPRYDFEMEASPAEDVDRPLTKLELRGLILAGFGSVIYLLIFIYNIIPGLPFSGNFLNYNEKIYIDMLFGTNSFFANGFVFIITMLFIIQGLLYGIGAKTIRNSHDFVDALGHSLNGIGKTLVFIFASATFISIFKQTNIGNVVVAFLTNIIAKANFSGLAMVILLFLFSAIATFFVPSTLAKWSIMSSQVVPAFLNVGLSAEFAQLIFRFGECVTLGLTPVFAYFIVYLAFLEKYNHEENGMNLFSAIKYQIPYSLCTLGILLAVIVLWYVISIPLGFGGFVNI